MRKGILIAALALMVSPVAAQADSGRISVADVHNFTAHMQNTINLNSLNDTRAGLDLIIAENATFTDRIASPRYLNGWATVGYGNPYSPYYYRYPYAPQYFAPVSHRAMTKSQLMGLVWNKKQAVPGYQTSMHVNNISFNAYGNAAVVDLDIKEYGAAYSPYHPGLMQRTIQANSRCTMNLTELNGSPVMTSLNCNTNSNLPM
jgi:hypothetical protein